MFRFANRSVPSSISLRPSSSALLKEGQREWRGYINEASCIHLFIPSSTPHYFCFERSISTVKPICRTLKATLPILPLPEHRVSEHLLLARSKRNPVSSRMGSLRGIPLNLRIRNRKLPHPICLPRLVATAVWRPIRLPPGLTRTRRRRPFPQGSVREASEEDATRGARIV